MIFKYAPFSWNGYVNTYNENSKIQSHIDMYMSAESSLIPCCCPWNLPLTHLWGGEDALDICTMMVQNVYHMGIGRWYSFLRIEIYPSPLGNLFSQRLCLCHWYSNTTGNILPPPRNLCLLLLGSLARSTYIQQELAILTILRDK